MNRRDHQRLKTTITTLRHLQERYFFSVALAGILLLALLLYLFYILFRSCLSDSSGQDSVDAFKNYLVSLQKKLSGGGPVDLVAERAQLDRMQNKIKKCNPESTIRADRELRFVFVRTYNMVTEWGAPPEAQVDRIRFSGLMEEFYETYFSGKVHGDMRADNWILKGAQLPRAASRPIRSKRLPLFPRPSWHSRS
jgi:hypothetical protein